MNVRIFPGLVSVVVLLVLGATTIAQLPNVAHAGIPAVVPASHGHLPSQVVQASELTQVSYQAAVDFPAVLAAVPCTCGCDALGHASNLDCYIHDIAGNGTILFDTHGINCGVCQLITRDALAGAQAGLTDAELLALIVEKYGP